MKGVVIDIGTGDGKFVYELAKKNPDKFIIGIDPDHSSVEKFSAKIGKKKAKGGLPNALYVLGDVSDLPDELTGVANQVFINFPWSSLLHGIVCGDANTWKNIKKVCQPGARISIVFGYDPGLEQSLAESFHLPKLSMKYIQQQMIPRIQSLRFEVLGIHEVTKDMLMNFPSDWAKRLAFGKDRQYYAIELRNE